MPVLPEPIENLTLALERLPGIGPKDRLASDVFPAARAGGSLSGAGGCPDGFEILHRLCQECFNITRSDQEKCEICTSDKRDEGIICVVEEPLDVLALERTAGYFGRYHVLHGVLSPIEGIGPEDLKIKPLLERVRTGTVTRNHFSHQSQHGRRRHSFVFAAAIGRFGGENHAPGARLAGRR